MLPYVVVNLLVALGFAAGWLLCSRVACHRPALAKAGAGLILLALVAKSVLYRFPAIEGACFPFSWYAWIYDAWIPALGLLFFGWAMPLVEVRWNRFVLALVVALVLGRSLWTTRWMAWPESHGDQRTADNRHHLRQSTQYTCAPAACVALLAHLEIAATEQEMAGLCLTRREGTSEFNTFRGLALKLDGSPWRARIRALSPQELCMPGRLAVISWESASHAITSVGQGDGVLIHDPLATDPHLWDLTKLTDRYGGTAVVVEPR